MITAKHIRDVVPGKDYIMGRDGKWYMVRQNRRAFLDKRLHFLSHAGSASASSFSYDDLIACNDGPGDLPQTTNYSVGPLTRELGL